MTTSGKIVEVVGDPRVASTDKRLHYLSLQATTEGQAAFAHVHEIVRGLRRRGWQIEVFEPHFSGVANIARKLLEFWRLQWRLFRHAQRPDIFYVRGHPLALPALLWARRCGIHCVVEVNSTYEDVFSIYRWTANLRGLVEGACDSCLRQADLLVTVTPELKHWLEARFPDKSVKVVPNGANTELFRPDVPASMPNLKPYVLFVGALSPWQGIETLLAATYQPDWPASVQLVIAGDGSLRSRVEAEVLENQQVHYLGTQPYEAIPGLLTGAIAAFSVGTSMRKNFSPLKLYEAMACGTPVIVSDQPGQASFVRELGCGVVIPAEDATAVARAVTSFANNQQERIDMGRRGAEAVHASHSWQQRADLTHTILLHAFRNGRSACG